MVGGGWEATIIIVAIGVVAAVVTAGLGAVVGLVRWLTS